jgi:hypothetical protein
MSPPPRPYNHKVPQNDTPEEFENIPATCHVRNKRLEIPSTSFGDALLGRCPCNLLQLRELRREELVVIVDIVRIQHGGGRKRIRENPRWDLLQRPWDFAHPTKISFSLVVFVNQSLYAVPPSIRRYSTRE